MSKANRDRLLEVVAEFRDGILDGRDAACMCYAVCAPMVSYLNISGWPDARLIDGRLSTERDSWNHYWIEIGRMIVDPTASQFRTPDGKRMPEIYFGPRPDWYLVTSPETHERTASR